MKLRLREKTTATLLIAILMMVFVVRATGSTFAITNVEDVYGNPISGGIKGDTVVVKGSGVTAGAVVNLYWDYVTMAGLVNTTEANPDGTFEVWFDVPEAVNGSHYLWVKDIATGSATSFGPFTVDSTITLDPKYGAPGATVEIVGSHFIDSSDSVSIELWDKELTTKILDLATIETDSNGRFIGIFMVPAVAFDTYKIVAIQGEPPISASEDFRIGLMVLIISPSEGPTGAEVAISGIGFTENGRWSATFGDVVIFVDEPVDAIGTISGLFIVPMVDFGTYTITVLDIETEIEIHANFFVTDDVDNSVLLTVEVVPTTVSISINPTSVDFGKVITGYSASALLTITHDGTALYEKITVELLSDTNQFYEKNLKVGGYDYDYSNWNIGIRPGEEGSAELELSVPQLYTLGVYTGTLVFWAEEIIAP